MKAEYIDDVKSGAGHGKLLLSQGRFPEGPWEIAIQRASDQSFLSGKSQNPWTGEKIFLAVEEEKPHPQGELALKLAPSIVDQLDPLEQYAISLKGNGEPQKARLRVSSITYSPASPLNNTPHPGADSSQNKSGPSSPASDEAPVAPIISDSPPIQPEAPSGPAQSAPLDLPESHSKESRKWRWPLLLLLALLCVAWYLLDPRFKEEKDSQPAASGGILPQEEALGKLKTSSEQVDDFFKRPSVSPRQAMELAAALPKSSAIDQDAIYRLYYFAAENGEQSAFIPYAAALDPSLAKWGSIEKNGRDAWEFYKKAHDVSGADHLMNWLQENAANNADARIWLEAIRGR